MAKRCHRCNLSDSVTSEPPVRTDALFEEAAKSAGEDDGEAYGRGTDGSTPHTLSFLCVLLISSAVLCAVRRAGQHGERSNALAARPETPDSRKRQSESPQDE